MKKEYSRPDFKTVDIKARQELLTASFDEELDNNGSDGGNALSREGFFDEDSEDDGWPKQ